MVCEPPCWWRPCELLTSGPSRLSRTCGSQQQYLVKGALYLLLVPAHRATDEEAEEVLLRWLDALQAKAPGAAVQVVLSHVDQLEAVQAQLAGFERRHDEYGDPLFESALEDLLDASPTALADAAASQLAWLKAQIATHAERTTAAATARGGTPQDLLRVQAAIPCVCAAEGGDASLLALREHLHTLLSATPPLVPSIGFVIPNSWAPALALPVALREGHSSSPSALPHPSVTASATASIPATEAISNAAKRPYVLLAELQSIWRDEVAPRAVPDEADPMSILTDALELLGNQGEIFIAAGMVFLDPGFATELLRPLVDHQLTGAADAKADVEKYVSATPGLASDAGLPARLLREVDDFVRLGVLSPALLPFFWRATALARSDYDAAKRMLIDAGVLIELEADTDKRLMMMPMRMCVEKPAAVASVWPSSTPPEEVTQLGVHFGLSGARLPPGVIERCVGSGSALKGYRTVECWRHGMLLADTARGETAGVVTALLELTSSELKVEVRGSGDAEALKQALAPLVGMVERVLLEYPGFSCDRQEH